MGCGVTACALVAFVIAQTPGDNIASLWRSSDVG